MSERKWDEYRCGQLADLETILTTVRDANNANNFIKRMAGASVLAESLLEGHYPTFVLFLHGLAIEDAKAKQDETVLRLAVREVLREMELAWNRESPKREELHAWGKTLRIAMGMEVG
jgi:hypothetical protein